MPGYYDRGDGHGTAVGDRYRPASSYTGRDSLGRNVNSSSSNGGGYSSSRYRDGGGYLSSGGGHGTGGYGMSSNTSINSNSSRYSSASNFESTPSYGSSYSHGATSGYASGLSGNSGTPSYGGTSGYSTMSRYGNGSSTYGNSSTYEGASGYSSSNRAAYGGASSHAASSYRSSQVMSPWQSGIHPSASAAAGGGEGSQAGLLPSPRSSNTALMQGRGRGGGSSDILGAVSGAVSQLQQMGNPESKLALNILNAVLTGPQEEGLADWGNSPPNKMRRLDWDGDHGMRRGQTLSPPMRSPTMRKFPQRDQQYQPHRVWDSEPPHLARASHSYGSAGHMMANDPFRRVAMAKRGKARPVTRDYRGPGKDQQKGKSEAAGTGAARTSDGQKGKMYEGGSSATAGPKQSVVTGNQSLRNAAMYRPGQQEYQQRPDVPKESLKCHMCNLTQFNTVPGYMRHLESKEHAISANAYHLHGAAILNLLRNDARLASQRQIVAAWKKGMKEHNLLFCNKCQCRVVGSSEEHQKTIEHLLVAQYMKVKCCGRPFTMRRELEEHRLSLHHLKVQGNMAKGREQPLKREEEAEAGTEEVTEEEALQMFKDAAQEHKTGEGKEAVTSLTLPPYDPKEAVGLHLLGIRSHYRCKVCPSRMETYQQVEKHFRSITHYQNMFTEIINVQEEKRKAKNVKKQEKDAAEGQTKEDSDAKTDKKNPEAQESTKAEENETTDKADEKTEDAEMTTESADVTTEDAEMADVTTEDAEMADVITEDAEMTADNADVTTEKAEVTKVANTGDECEGGEAVTEDLGEEEAVEEPVQLKEECEAADQDEDRAGDEAVQEIENDNTVESHEDDQEGKADVAGTEVCESELLEAVEGEEDVAE